MTFLIAIKASNGIACATDSRVSWTTQSGRNAKSDGQAKMWWASKEAPVIIMMTSDAYEFGRYIVNEIRLNVEAAERKGPVDALKVADIIFNTKHVFTGTLYMVAGYTTNEKTGVRTPEVYRVSDPNLNNKDYYWGHKRTVERYTSPVCMEGITRWAVPVINGYGQENLAKMDIDEAVSVAVEAVQAASKESIYVGGPIQAIAITPTQSWNVDENEMGEAIVAIKRRAAEREKERARQNYTPPRGPSIVPPTSPSVPAPTEPKPAPTPAPAPTPTPAQTPAPDALAILKLRLAKGEINEEQYKRLHDLLTAGD